MRQETEAFGRTIATTGSPVSPYGYHGAEGYRSDGDGPAGLEPYQKVGARYYDATFGRFITRDTELSQAPYAYCDGDPVNFSDPTGHLSAVNIASGGVPTINGPAGTGTGLAVSSSDSSSSSSKSGSSSNGGSGTYKIDITVKQQDPITTFGLAVTLTLGRTTLTNTDTATITPITTSFGSVFGVSYQFGGGFSAGVSYTTPTAGKGGITMLTLTKSGKL